jgi:hypothetical protein
MAVDTHIHAWSRDSRLRGGNARPLRGTAVLTIATGDGLLVVGDKFALGKDGPSDSQNKIAIADKHLALGLWGTGGLQSPDGQMDMVLLSFVADYFSTRELTGTDEQFSELERAWGEWFIACCDRHKCYPVPTESGIWAQILLASNHKQQMRIWLLDFFYRRTPSQISLELQSFPLSSAGVQATIPQIYGCFGRLLPFAQELRAAIQRGRATDEERELLTFLVGTFDLKSLRPDRAILFAKLIVRDFHFNDRDPQGAIHVGSTVDAILLPWQGEAHFLCTNETVLEMTEDEIRAAVESAIDGVRHETPSLNFQRAHERSTAHRLAVHMEPHFSGHWNVDCEYDRDGLTKKTLEGIAECSTRRTTDEILPDILVHRRERQGRPHNLLVIELKKDAVEDPCDLRKLELMTHPNGHYQYQLGLYINIDGGSFSCTWYKNGRRLD